MYGKVVALRNNDHEVPFSVITCHGPISRLCPEILVATDSID
jgi:hypothetical protein